MVNYDLRNVWDYNLRRQEKFTLKVNCLAQHYNSAYCNRKSWPASLLQWPQITKRYDFKLLLQTYIPADVLFSLYVY